MSTDDRKTQLGVVVDATEARQGFNEVKQGARDMAQAVAAEGDKASKSVGGIGEGGQQSSQKVEAATRSMIQSIQRTTAAMEAGSKTSSQYYEALAKQRGVDPAALRPYLDQLDSMQSRQKDVGVSAAQMSAALRGLPAQFTDIATSLASGQQPLTVLLQQGGQLKDMFGGVGPAARALAGYVAGLVNPFTLAAAAAGALFIAYRSGAAEGEEFRKTLVLTGNALGLNADKLQAMSARIGASVGTQHQAAAALVEMAQAAKVGTAGLEAMTAAAVRWEDATGTAVSETAKQFAELAKSPLEASLKLNEATNYLTDSVYKQIKALQEAGKETDAAALAQKAYADALNDRAPKVVQNLGTIETAWRNIKEAATSAWDWALKLGRDKTVEEQIKAQTSAVDALQQKLRERQDRGMAVGRLPEQLDAAKALLETLRQQVGATDAAAEADRQRSEQFQRSKRIGDYTDDKDRKSRAQQMRDDLEKERNVYEARKKDASGNAADLLAIESAYRAAVANIRDKYKEKSSGGGISTTDTELASLRSRIDVEKLLAAQLGASGGQVAKLNEGEKLSLDYAEKLKLATNGKTKARLEEMRVMAEQLGVLQRSNASAAEYAKQAEKYMDDRAKEVADIEKKAVALEAENLTYGLGKAAVESMTIARLEERKAILLGFDGSEEQIKLLEAEIDARKRLMAATSQKETLDANKKAAEQAATDWKKSTEQVEQALTNALMEGGKSGKEYVEGLFRTMVLRPLISAVVNPIAGAVGGVFGQSGGAQGSNLLQAGQQVNSLYNMYNNAGAYYNYAANTLFGSSIPAATGAAFGGVGGLASGVFGAGAGASIYGSGVAGAAYGANAGLSLYGTGTAMSLSGGTAGLSASAGSAGAAAGMTGAMAVPIAGWIAAGMAMADSMFAKGWDAQKVDFTGFGKVTGSATLAFDKLLRGIGMSDRLANIISGASIHAALFGRKKPEVQASGIEGDFTADGFEGDGFTDWKAKGGWFRRSKSWTERAALDEMQSATLQGAVSGALGFYRNLDKLAGGAGMAEREGSFSYHVRADLRGEGALDKVLTDMSNALGQHVLPDLLRFQREGESVADTAQRLTDVFSATNTVAEVLGKTAKEAFGALGLSTAQVRQNLIDVAGGLDAFSAKVSSYYEIYYTDQEKLTRLQDQMRDAFGDLGLVMPSSRDGFRALVESLDLTSESGQELFSTLLDIAPSFAQMTEGLEAFGKQVREFQQSLVLGDLTTLTPEQQYAEAKRRYDATSAAALSGDSTAQAQWTQIAQAFLEASRDFFASGGQYAADFSSVQGFRPNGSHANGLAYVPFDGYLAELHQGERVLTRAENTRYSTEMPDWSQYGRGDNAELVAEIRALNAKVEALKETLRQVEQAKEVQAGARHAEVLAVQTQQARLQQQLVDK